MNPPAYGPGKFVLLGGAVCTALSDNGNDVYSIIKYGITFICKLVRFFNSFKSRLPYQVEIKKRKWVCQRLVCQKMEFAARWSSYEVSRCEV